MRRQQTVLACGYDNKGGDVMGHSMLLFGAAAHAGADVHYHECPECHTLPACGEDCAIEPDLGLTPGGNPKGSFVVCQACERAQLTPSEIALAKMLAAVEEWRANGGHDGSPAACTFAAACDPLVSANLLFPGTGQARTAGAALLDRARKAGVL